jgi:lipoyl(octanoyl) transferase
VNTLLVHNLGRVDYGPVYSWQRGFNAARDAQTPDELWRLEHPPVYTLGLAGLAEHILHPGGIPVHRSDRGGQVTYHGPGQLVVYPLIDLKRKGIPVKRYVYLLEQAVIDMLEELAIEAYRQDQAPGVYTRLGKIAALGVRIRRGCCYHGLSLNVKMDLAPYSGINPCGYPGLKVTQLFDFGAELTVAEAGDRLLPWIVSGLGYDGYREVESRDVPAVATQGAG